MLSSIPRSLRIVSVVAAVACLPAAAIAFQPAKSTAPTTAAGATAEKAGDPVRGKAVFMKLGVCSECHGWAGDGEHGKHPRSPGIAANLRESQLTPEDMAQVVRCGIPGTAMPYHLSQAYKDPDICYGMTMADFADGEAPSKGKTFREKDILNVVAYVQSQFVGRGPITLAECEEIRSPATSSATSFAKPPQRSGAESWAA